ncbi:MAG: acylphosphatase [Desulfuromonadaceae bacterium]|nr:acylphosphatase [Desulfuromonadaceae bacterium]
MSKQRVTVNVTGTVQGVNFRYITYRQALALGVAGWVKNLPDGSVQLCFEGEERAVKQLLDWLHVGPSSARVDKLTIQPEAYRGEFDCFEILR